MHYIITNLLKQINKYFILPRFILIEWVGLFINLSKLPYCSHKYILGLETNENAIQYISNRLDYYYFVEDDLLKNKNANKKIKKRYGINKIKKQFNTVISKYNLYSDVNNINIIKPQILELCKKMCEHNHQSSEYSLSTQICKNLVKNKNIFRIYKKIYKNNTVILCKILE